MHAALLNAAAGAAEAALAPLRPLSTELREQQRALDRLDHRPWPLPSGAWAMGQTWCDLLFAHWRVPPEAVRPLVPPQLGLDLQEGHAWIGLTPFVIRGLRVAGTPPLPVLSTFPELNVRTYVSVEDKPGIFFLSLDAGSRLAVAAARRTYRLPYFAASITVERQGGWTVYRSERRDPSGEPALLDCSFRPAEPELGVWEDPLGRWLSERYCLYTIDERGRVLRGDIHHAPWPLQPAEAEVRRNTMADPFGIALAGEPLLHYSARQDTLIWPLRPLAWPGRSLRGGRSG